MIEITIAGVIGLAAGMLIDRNARRERDERIKELEQEVITQRNVVKSLNEDNVKLRKQNKKWRDKSANRSDKRCSESVDSKKKD